MSETITDFGIPERAVKSERTELTVLVANITRLRIFIGMGVEEILDTDCHDDAGTR